MRWLGEMYVTGEGVPQDYLKALLILEKAAAMVYAPAMKDIGSMYQNGQNVKQDSAPVMQWPRHI